MEENAVMYFQIVENEIDGEIWSTHAKIMNGSALKFVCALHIISK